MLLRSPISRRRGTTVVECAIVYPATFLLVLGLLVGGLGVFRYQQAAHLARAAARFAAVRGGQYAAEMRCAAATEQAVRDYVISQSAALDVDPATLGVRVVLNVSAAGGGLGPAVTAVPWDASSKAPYTVISDNGQARQNTVTVTVTYRWLPEAFLGGPLTLTSTATIPMQY